MNPFDNLRHNPILEEYRTNPMGVSDVIDNQHNAMYWTDALLTAAQNGWKDLLVAVLPKVPAQSFKGAALQTALLHNQNEMVEFLLPQTSWEMSHTAAAFNLIRAKNAPLFKKVLPRIPAYHIKDSENNNLNMFEACVYCNWYEGVEILLAENDRREYEGKDSCVDLHKSDDYGLNQAYERANFDILKLIASRVHLSERSISNILEYAPTEYVVDILDIFKIGSKDWQYVLDTAVKGDTDEVWNWDLIKTALQHTTPTDHTTEVFLGRLCRLGDYPTYTLLEPLFSTTEVKERHITNAAKSGNKDLMVKLLAKYTKNLPNDIVEQAASSGSLEMVKLFANPQNIRKRSNNILISAIEGKNVEVLKHLIPFSNTYANNSRALWEAVESNQQDMVDVLLPLSNPAAQQGDILVECVNNNNMAMFEQLLPYCCPRDDDSSALYRACIHGRMDFVQRLLPLSDVSAEGYQAISAAVNGSHSEIVKHLLQLPEVQEDLENVRHNVYESSNHGLYHIFTDCLAELEREKIEQSMNPAPDSSLKRRRM